VNALERIFEARDRDHLVNVVSDNRVRIGKDRFSFRVTSAKPGYVYVLMVGTDRSFNLLFPNAVDNDNRIAPGQALDLPRAGWSMTAGGPKGADHFVAIVSENPRDFSAAGLRKVDPFGEFPADVAAKLSASAGSAPLFAGKPVLQGGWRLLRALRRHHLLSRGSRLVRQRLDRHPPVLGAATFDVFISSAEPFRPASNGRPRSSAPPPGRPRRFPLAAARASGSRSRCRVDPHVPRSRT
jgi:hypothetical protein